MKKYEIKNRVTYPYHPQANGQVESTNKALENILTKTIANHHRNWAKNFLRHCGRIKQHGGTQ